MPDGLRAGSCAVLSYSGSAAPEDTSHAMLLRVQAEKLADAQAVRGTVCSVNSKQGSIGYVRRTDVYLPSTRGNPSPGSRAEWSREMVCASLIPVASAGNPPVPHSFCHWRSRPGKMPIRAPCSVRCVP